MNAPSREKLEKLIETMTSRMGCLREDQAAALHEAIFAAYEVGRDENRVQQVYLNHLMEHLPERIYFKDLHSRFLLGNRAFINNFGVAEMDEVFGKSDFDFFPHDLAVQKFEDEQRIILDGKPIQKDESDERVEGRIAWSSTIKMPLTNDEGRIIGTFGLSRDITDKKLAEQRLKAVAEDLACKNEQIESDVNMARRLQTAFIPTTYPAFIWDHAMEGSALRFSHRYVPSEALAGDFFQIIPISSSKAGILICDVMGHGIRASLVTAILRGLVGELNLITPYPHVFLRKVNRSLNSVLRQLDITLFVTAFYGVIDLERGIISYTNAGHPLPVIANRSKGSIEMLPVVSEDPEPALGLVDGFRYSFQTLPIEEGDVLFFYTDGIIEVANSEDEEFGFDRFLKLLSKRANITSDEVLESLMDEIHVFSEGQGTHDDMCIICVDVNKIATPES